MGIVKIEHDRNTSHGPSGVVGWGYGSWLGQQRAGSNWLSRELDDVFSVVGKNAGDLMI